MKRPKRTFVWVSSSLGHYDFLHPEKEQASFVFHNLQNGLRCCYSVNEKYIGLDEGLSPLEVAEQLQNIFCTEYLYTSSKEAIGEVVDFLESNQDAWLKESLTYKVELANYEMAEWGEKKAKAEKRLAEMGKPS